MEKDNSRRGFAGMSDEKRREIASLGGKAAHRAGTAHQFNSEEASAAGKKGGSNVFAKLGSPHMSNIGRAGGKARGKSQHKLTMTEPDPLPIAGELHGMDRDDNENDRPTLRRVTAAPPMLGNESVDPNFEMD